jgi:GntR family transcriptional regulator/MocR family aminotransferase
MQLVIAIDSKSTSTLQAQIYDQIRRMICDRLIVMGAPLPSTRALAKQLSLSRNTVMLAYSRLADEGYITFRPTQGTYVNHRLPDECISVASPVAGQPLTPEVLAPPRLRFKGAPHRVASPHRSRSIIDFWPGVPDRASFPMAAWKKGLIRNFESAGTVLTEYCDPLGMPELREAIAAHLGPSRGMKVKPDQIIVVTSTQMALNVISRLIVLPQTQVVMEDPCYEGAANVFESYGAWLHPVAVDEHGLRTEELPENGAALAYVTPSHQYPYGYTMSSERRHALLDWAERTQSYLVEDDYDADFHFSGSPLPALAALDVNQRVFHLGTFSKSLGPGVRVGFMVVPRPILQQAAAAKTLMDHGSSWLEQSVLAGFLKSGAYSAHLRKIRHLYADRLCALKKALNACQIDAELMGEQCGMHVVWKLPPGARSASEIALAALRRGVAVYPIDQCFSRIFVPRAEQHRMLILGYAAISERYIEEGVRRIARHAFMH